LRRRIERRKRRSMKRALLVLLILVLIVSFFAFDLGHFLTLESLKHKEIVKQ
jgi:hypothetical protein